MGIKQISFVGVVLAAMFSLAAWIAGNVVYFVFRVRAVAGICAASTRVVLRGLALIGILILIEHLIALFAPTHEDDRKLAGKYFLYFGVVILAVIYFFGQLGVQELS